MTESPGPKPEPTPSYVKLTKLAGALREDHPDLTEAQAFTKVYTDPANRKLVSAEKAERRAAATIGLGM